MEVAAHDRGRARCRKRIDGPCEEDDHLAVRVEIGRRTERGVLDRRNESVVRDRDTRVVRVRKAARRIARIGDHDRSRAGHDHAARYDDW